MSFFMMLMTAFALSLDAFAVSVSCGITRSADTNALKIKLAAFFGFFQAIMPLGAYYLSDVINVDLGRWTGFVAFILLLAIGIHMILESFKKEEECGYGQLTLKRLFILSIATSIDAFATGISMSLLGIGIWLPILMIGVITFFMSLTGVYFGCRIGDRIKNGAELTGGFILIIIGIKILIENLAI